MLTAKGKSLVYGFNRKKKAVDVRSVQNVCCCCGGDAALDAPLMVEAPRSACYCVSSEATETSISSKFNVGQVKEDEVKVGLTCACCSDTGYKRFEYEYEYYYERDFNIDLPIEYAEGPINYEQVSYNDLITEFDLGTPFDEDNEDVAVALRVASKALPFIQLKNNKGRIKLEINMDEFYKLELQDGIDIHKEAVRITLSDIINVVPVDFELIFASKIGFDQFDGPGSDFNKTSNQTDQDIKLFNNSTTPFGEFDENKNPIKVFSTLNPLT